MNFTTKTCLMLIQLTLNMFLLNWKLNFFIFFLIGWFSEKFSQVGDCWISCFKKKIKAIPKSPIQGPLRVQIHFRKFSRGPRAQYDFSLEKIVLRMRSAENSPFRGKFSEVYIHLYCGEKKKRRHFIGRKWRKYVTFSQWNVFIFVF